MQNAVNILVAQGSDGFGFARGGGDRVIVARTEKALLALSTHGAQTGEIGKQIGAQGGACSAADQRASMPSAISPAPARARRASGSGALLQMRKRPPSRAAVPATPRRQEHAETHNFIDHSSGLHLDDANRNFD